MWPKLSVKVEKKEKRNAPELAFNNQLSTQLGGSAKGHR
jgi:hypothetical protein